MVEFRVRDLLRSAATGRSRAGIAEAVISANSSREYPYFAQAASLTRRKRSVSVSIIHIGWGFSKNSRRKCDALVSWRLSRSRTIRRSSPWMCSPQGRRSTWAPSCRRAAAWAGLKASGRAEVTVTAPMPISP